MKRALILLSASLFSFSHYCCRSQRLVNPCSGSAAPACFVPVYLPAGTKRTSVLPPRPHLRLNGGKAKTAFDPRRAVAELLIQQE